MNQDDIVRALDEQIENRRDAERWRKLMKLVGTPANASDEPVTLCWDDATMAPFISVGRFDIGMSDRRRDYFIERGSFEQVMDSIPEPKD